MDLPKFNRRQRKKPGPEPKKKEKLRRKYIHFYITDSEEFEIERAAGVRNKNSYSRTVVLETARRKNRRKM